MHRVTGYTDDGRPVRVVRNVLPGDRHLIAFERTRPTKLTKEGEL
ncbi:hypothetical protein [Actinomycetospora flava]|uniref:YD repeat-containing protein n=1 Tax=Actinomycetospora flava TaxID=3129232 RepID=A0ABU8M858_9PSEU